MIVYDCLFTGEVTDTKVMLESCLLQWTDFNDSYEQIQKRLKEMEKRLRGADTKADLGEKKAELQRVKVNFRPHFQTFHPDQMTKFNCLSDDKIVTFFLTTKFSHFPN